MPPSSPFETPLLEIGDRLADVRSLLSHLDGMYKLRQGSITRSSRALAYVAIAAALEEFVRDFVDEMAAHINAAKVPMDGLQPGIVSLIQAPDFQSASDLRRQGVWDRRAEIIKMASSQQQAALIVGLRPLDGRTIKSDHLRSLWSIYELPGSSLPSPLHSLALKDLSDGRNDVAHGNVDPATFGGTKSYADVVRRVEQVEEIAIHMAATASGYVLSGDFRR